MASLDVCSCVLYSGATTVENVYNLREENKQLRKAHQDIHIQLQDARVSTKGEDWTVGVACVPYVLIHVFPIYRCQRFVPSQFQHMDLKAAHDQLALTLEDHKSALATAQVGTKGERRGVSQQPVGASTFTHLAL